MTLLFTADLHSHLLPERIQITARDAANGLGIEGQIAEVGGAARLATVLDVARGDGPSFLFDAGDLLEGTSFFPAFHGEPEMRVAEALGIDAMAFGNHDEAQGAAFFDALRRKWATFPLLAANFSDELAAGLVAPYVVVERSSVRVLVVGLGRRSTSEPNLDECVAAVDAIVTAHRAEADLVVVTSHLGHATDVALAARTSGVDVILGGHTHDVTSPPIAALDRDGERVFVVHPGAYGRWVGRANFVVSRDGEDVASDRARPSAVVDVRFSLLPVSATTPPQEGIAQLVAPYEATLAAGGDDRIVAFAPRTISRRAVSRGDSALGDLVTDALRQATSADVAIMNSTGIRADVVAGPVSASDVTRILPFSDTVSVARFSVQELVAALRGPARDACAGSAPSPFEVAGIGIAVTCSPLSVALTGLPEGADTVRVAAPSFLTVGKYLAPSGLNQLESSPESVRDAVARALEQHPTCAGARAAGLDVPCLTAVADGRVQLR